MVRIKNKKWMMFTGLIICMLAASLPLSACQPTPSSTPTPTPSPTPTPTPVTEPPITFDPPSITIEYPADTASSVPSGCYMGSWSLLLNDSWIDVHQSSGYCGAALTILIYWDAFSPGETKTGEVHVLNTGTAGISVLKLYQYLETCLAMSATPAPNKKLNKAKIPLYMVVLFRISFIISFG